MDRVSRKVTSIALAAVLCFWMAFPVSAFVKPERAEAIAPALAIPVIFGTVCAAAGVYVGGVTLSSYSDNVSNLMSGFQTYTANGNTTWNQYVADKGSFDNAMNSFVTEQGNISLQAVSDSGLFDDVRSYSAYCVNNGTMATGPSSLGTVTQNFNMFGLTFNTFSSVPWSNYFQTYVDQMQASNPSYVYMVSLNIQQNGSNTDYNLYYYDSDRVPVYDNSSYHSMYNNRKMFRYAYIQVNSSGGLNASRSGVSSTSSFDIYDNTRVYDSAANTGYGCYINPSVTFVNANNSSVTGELVQGQEGLATYDATVVPSTSTVAPFEPTAEQVSAGFDSSAIVEAINSGNAQTAAGINDVISTLTGTIGGVLNDIKTGVNGLETAIGTAISTGATSVIDGVSSAINTGVNTLSTVLNDIKTASQTIEQTLGGAISTTLTGIATGIAGVGTTLGDIWGDLQGWYTDWLAWVGTTPLGALIAQVIAALNAGVLDLSGLLELVNAGVLDLSTAIELVQTAVQDGVAEITGAIEGIQFPSFEWPKVEGTPQVALPPGDMRSSMDAVIQDKAPFAYMYTFGEGIQSLEYSSEPKFRMRHMFDIVADEVEIDINAEPWLNRDLGGVTIAQLLRASVTLTLCMGLLYGAYKTAMAAVKAG